MISMQEFATVSELGKFLSANKSVLAMCHASWCGYCQRFLPEFEKLAAAAPIQLIKIRIDEDENPLWDSLNVPVVPTLVLFESGREKTRLQALPGKGISKEMLADFRRKAGF